MIHLVEDYYASINPAGGYTLVQKTGKIDKKTGKENLNYFGYYGSVEEILKFGLVRTMTEEKLADHDMELSEAVKTIQKVGEMIEKKMSEPIESNRRIAKFYKVSKERFITDYVNTVAPYDSEFYRKQAEESYDDLKLPVRATSGSAGYDFFSPINFVLKPNETINIPTGIRVEIANDWVLKCYPKSGLGFKYRLQLNNTVGIVDADYFYSDNEGHIFAKITNDTNESKEVCIGAGKGFMQGVFVQYGITVDDDAKCKRNGGFGSTGA